VVDLLQARAQVGEPAVFGPTLLLQVRAGGETAPRAGDQERPQRLVVGDGRHSVEQVATELVVPGVERIGPVEQNPGRRTVRGQVDRLV
jgi:hypothetical protein